MTAVTLDGLQAWLREFARLVADSKEYLTRLDSAIGDADHGINMDRGMRAVVAALDGEEFTQASDLFKKVGMTLVRIRRDGSLSIYTGEERIREQD